MSSIAPPTSERSFAPITLSDTGWLTTPHVCVRLGISVETLRRRVRAGVLPVHRLDSRTMLFRVEEVEAMAARIASGQS